MSIKKLVLQFIVFFICFSIQAQEYQIVSYNIKYDNIHDTVNNWNDRKAEMVNLLKKYNIHFIGMQEVLFHQLKYIDHELPQHKYIGVGRDDGKQKGEFSPIFFDAEKFQLISANTFWLSKTPNKISVGWDAAMERICTYGLFQDISTKEKIWIFNTHFDHIGVKAREKAAKLIIKKINQLNKEKLPVVLMGDFNLLPEEKPIKYIQKKMDDGMKISKNIAHGPKGTFNGFNTNAPIEKRIDYIFTYNFEVINYLHIDKRLSTAKHISDHLPVLATLKNN